MTDSARQTGRPGVSARLDVVAVGVLGLCTALLVAYAVPAVGVVLDISPPSPWWTSVFDLVGCAALFAASLADHATGGRPISAGVALTGVGLYFPFVAASNLLPATVRAAALAVEPLTLIGLAMVIGRREKHWPGSPRIRMGVAAAATAGVVHFLTYDPFRDPGCRLMCEPVGAPFSGLVHGAMTSGLYATLFALAAGCLLVETAVQPDLPAPTRGGVGVALFALTAATVVPWLQWGQSPSGVDDILRTLAAIVVAVIGLAQAWRGLIVRITVGRIMTDMSSVASGAESGSLHFFEPDQAIWVDIAGQRVPDDLPESVRVAGPKGELFRLPTIHHADAAEILSTVSPARMLALDNARLTALGRARLEAVRLSEDRLRAARRAEQRRLEHDLHDRMQQPLVAALLHLERARNRADPANRPAFAASEVEIREVLGRLQDIAHHSFSTPINESNAAATPAASGGQG